MDELPTMGSLFDFVMLLFVLFACGLTICYLFVVMLLLLLLLPLPPMYFLFVVVVLVKCC